MEQARYWMWTKRKHSSLSNSHVLQTPSTNTNLSSSSYDQDSWEEQAFAQDAAGGLGGCVWPPRSYSCSFCKREFRSAQALGGHMNVHRRDRARLKQSPPSTPPPPPHHQILDHHHNNPFTNALFHHYPYHQDVRTLVYNHNTNPNLDPPLIASPTSPPTRVSLLSFEKTCFPPFSSSSTTTMMQQHQKRQRFSASSSPRSSTDEEELVKNHSRVSMSLNLVVAVSDDDNEKEQEEEESDRIYKKRRIDASSVSSLPFVAKSRRSVEMINLCSLEEMDLELRLGQRPKGRVMGDERCYRDMMLTSFPPVSTLLLTFYQSIDLQF